MVRGSINDRRHRWKSTSLIWIPTAFLIYLGLRMLLSSSKSPIGSPSISDGRTALYDMMSGDLVENGPAFLRGRTSQSLLLSNIFETKNGVVTPVLKASSPPARANILYISPEYSIPISQIIKDIFLPCFDRVIWFQNTSLYHSSMFHASHNVTSVFATDVEVCHKCFFLHNGKYLVSGLWTINLLYHIRRLSPLQQMVSSGSDPLLVRTKLKDALPRAPDKQLYDPVIFHSTFARIVGHPNIQLKEQEELKYFQDLVSHVNNKLRGFKATIKELWYVEEFDVLALALDGKMKIHKFRLGCSGKF